MNESNNKYVFPGPKVTGEFIRQLRVSHNLTQEELGNKVYVTRKAVSKWENGICYPSMEIIPRLADIFGITLEELLSGKFKENTTNDTSRGIKFLIKVVKSRRVKTLVTLIVLTLILCLLIFFYENYNSTKIYEVYSDDGGIIGNGMIVETRAQEFLNFNYFTLDLKDLNEDEPIDFTLYIKESNKDDIDLLKFSMNSTTYFEKTGYREIPDIKIKDNYENLYMKISYTDINKNVVQKDINLKVKLYYQSNDIYNFKKFKDDSALNMINESPIFYGDYANASNVDENLTIDLGFLYDMSEDELKKKYDGKSIEVDCGKITIKYKSNIIIINNLDNQITINLTEEKIYLIENNNQNTWKITNKDKIKISSKQEKYYNYLKLVFENLK